MIKLDDCGLRKRQNGQKGHNKRDSRASPDSASPTTVPTPSWVVDIDLELSEAIVAFAYFLMIPILVYRTSYPHTKRIRWNRVWQHFRDVMLTIASVWVLFCRFCVPIYRKSISEPGTFSSIFSEFINGSIPGMMLLLLGFFGFLHSWLNLFAELLRFGDRQFYEDWYVD